MPGDQKVEKKSKQTKKEKKNVEEISRDCNINLHKRIHKV